MGMWKVHRGLRDDDGQALAAVAVARGGEDVVVARRLEHGLVAGQDPVAAVRLGLCDRALLAQRAVGPTGSAECSSELWSKWTTGQPPASVIAARLRRGSLIK